MGIPFDKYDTVIGLEVHAQLKTASNIFFRWSLWAPSNTLIDPISLGHPGTLPVLNKKQVELAVRRTCIKLSNSKETIFS